MLCQSWKHVDLVYFKGTGQVAYGSKRSPCIVPHWTCYVHTALELIHSKVTLSSHKLPLQLILNTRRTKY